MTSPAAIRDLQGNVALVTGATSGIGHATALQLAAQGATVIVHGRDASRGAAVVAEIEKSGGSARFVSAELDEPGEGLRLAEEVGDVDILINNAGFAWFGPSAKLDADTLDQLFAANVQAPYLLVSVLAPKMVARGGGVIINIASRAGIVGQANTAAYGASKAALASLARSWAAEYGPAASASTPSHRDRSTPTRPNGKCSIPSVRPPCWVGRVSHKRSPRSSAFWRPPAPPTSPAPTWPSTVAASAPKPQDRSDAMT
jgi:NAD(P)-dependent dehydrogenase (short-subunit alcohol dehydrogenase family)